MKENLIALIKIIVYLSPTIPLYYIMYVQYGLGYAILTVAGILGLFVFLTLLFYNADKPKVVTN